METNRTKAKSYGPMPHPVSPADAPRCDVLVVGGGINGAGIARDLAGRGLAVTLCEQDDLAAHTSSCSTKLIHGGLRYLEHREFALVRKALQEREGLLRGSPHIMWPLRFVMPHDAHLRPAWLIRIGLFLYDHLAQRELLPGSSAVDLRSHPAGAPLKPGFTKGFIYSDGWVDDARLVALNAVDAAERGARIVTRCRCTDAQEHEGGWRATLEHRDGRSETLSARALVNAAGPWAAQFLKEHAGLDDSRGLRLVKGSHIVVRKLFEHDHAYIFQNPDQRIIFAIPYEGDFTLIGTTDVEYRGVIGQAQIDDDEIAYLCEQASRYFAKPVQAADVVWSYAGVRPLLDDESASAAKASRDYELELDVGLDVDAGGRANGSSSPLLNVWGGKITTFRRLAEEAVDILCANLGHAGPAWTAKACLPGGDLSAEPGYTGQPQADIARLIARTAREHPQWPARMVQRLAHAYGSRLTMLLDHSGTIGPEVAPGLHEGELHYLHAHEWARTVDDVLWRRSKLGLHLDATGREAVARWWQHTFPLSDAVPANAALQAA
jgi:glycerol-3-phosphate dehydrogenase